MMISGTASNKPEEIRNLNLHLEGEDFYQKRTYSAPVSQEALVATLRKEIYRLRTGKVSVTITAVDGVKLKPEVVNELTRYFREKHSSFGKIKRFHVTKGLFPLGLKAIVSYELLRKREKSASNIRTNWSFLFGLGLACVNPLMSAISFGSLMFHALVAIWLNIFREGQMEKSARHYDTNAKVDALDNPDEKDAFLDGYKAALSTSYMPYLSSFGKMRDWRHWRAFQGGQKLAEMRDDEMTKSLGLESEGSPSERLSPSLTRL